MLAIDSPPLESVMIRPDIMVDIALMALLILATFSGVTPENELAADAKLVPISGK